MSLLTNGTIIPTTSCNRRELAVIADATRRASQRNSIAAANIDRSPASPPKGDPGRLDTAHRIAAGRYTRCISSRMKTSAWRDVGMVCSRLSTRSRRLARRAYAPAGPGRFADTRAPCHTRDLAMRRRTSFQECWLILLWT